MAENIKILADREDIVAIANAVRNKTGTSGEMTLGGIASSINNISTSAALPALSNEGVASELFADKELIDGDGNVVTGTFTIDSELTTQDNLITQIQTALQNKASATPVLQTKTVIPTTSTQNVTPDSGYDGLSRVTVNAIPSTYIKPTTTKSATTYTPTTSNQTIAAGTYCSGAQTIKGDANLKAENIAEGVSIFGVTGTHSGGSSGGGSMETCTITVADAFADGFPLEIITTTISNGVETPYVFLHEYGDNTSSPPYTISNVKCGSIIAIICNKAYASVPYVETSNGSVLISACQVAENRHGGYALVYVFTAPITANAHSTIVVDSQ